MNCIVEYQNKGKYLHKHFKGKITVEDYIHSWETVFEKNLLTEEHIGVIVHLNGNRIQIKADDVQQKICFFDKHIQKLRNKRIAHIIQTPDIAVFMLLSQKYKNVKNRCFSTHEEARKWLKID